jgi:hypothetical protein
MDPVMRALQSIADIENETRELGQLEPASACRTARFEPTTTYATSEGTADLNTDSRALEIADVETNASEAAGAWDEEIKIGRRDRIVISPARDVTRHAVTLIVGASLSALAFCDVWLGGSDSHFTVEQHCAPDNRQIFSRSTGYCKTGPASASSADAIAAPIGSVHGTSKRGVQHIEPSLIKQAAKAPQRNAAARTDLSKPTAVAETRPTTMAGWVIREVNGNTAVLEGPNGV